MAAGLRLDPPDAAVHGVDGVDAAGGVGGDPEDEAVRVGDLGERVVVLDAVDLAGLATDVDPAIGGHGDPFRMVEPVGERLDAIEADRPSSPFTPSCATLRQNVEREQRLR